MTRSNDKKPPPSGSPGTGRAPDRKPGRSVVNSETFGRFVGNLARLEGGGDQKGKEGKR
jgi:hypothetical protein